MLIWLCTNHRMSYCYYFKCMISKYFVLQSLDKYVNGIVDSFCTTRSHSNIKIFIHPNSDLFQTFPLLPSVKPIIICPNCVLVWICKMLQKYGFQTSAFIESCQRQNGILPDRAKAPVPQFVICSCL